MSQYAKALAALLTALAGWGYTATADGHVTAPEWFGLCGVLVAALAVYALPNTPAPSEPTPVQSYGPVPMPSYPISASAAGLIPAGPSSNTAGLIPVSDLCEPAKPAPAKPAPAKRVRK